MKTPDHSLVDGPRSCALEFPFRHELVRCGLRGRWIDDTWEEGIEIHLVPLEIPTRFYYSPVRLIDMSKFTSRVKHFAETRYEQVRWK